MLRQCLACWNMGAAGDEAGAQSSARQDTVEMLVGFVEQSDGPTAAQIVDIAQVYLSLCTILTEGIVHSQCNLISWLQRCSLHTETPRVGKNLQMTQASQLCLLDCAIMTA